MAEGTSTSREKLGKVLFYLLKENFITKENINYAKRIQQKLHPPKPLLEVLKELNYVDDEKINQTIRTNRDHFKIGTLLVELGYITLENLNNALRIQYEEKNKRLIGDILIDNKVIDERRLVELLSMQMGFPYLEPEFMDLDPDLFALGDHKRPQELYPRPYESG